MSSDRRALRLLADAQLSRAIQVVATLGVADQLVAGPRPAGELAALAGCDPDALGRLLRYLAFAGVLDETADGRFGLTGPGELLRSDVEGSMREELSIGADDRGVWWSTGELLHSVRTGKPAYDKVFGVSMWQTMRSAPESSQRFQQSMTQASGSIVDELVSRYDWPATGTVADLGGGSGTVLAGLLGARPALSGMLVDLPEVVAAADQRLAAAGLADRCVAVPADLFSAVPPGADRYLLMRVLHDWPDESAAAILRNCRAACGQGGRLVIVDMEVGPADELGLSLVGDLLMLLLVGGRERTRAELDALLGAAGFEVTGRIPLRPPYVAVEARPVGDG